MTNKDGGAAFPQSEWWKGKALDQATHERINAQHYPGTRQLCCECDQPTGRCEDDSIYIEDIGPLCEDCYEAKDPTP